MDADGTVPSLISLPAAAWSAICIFISHLKVLCQSFHGQQAGLRLGETGQIRYLACAPAGQQECHHLVKGLLLRPAVSALLEQAQQPVESQTCF